MAKSKKQQAETENSSEITWGEIKQRSAKEADELAQAIHSETLKFCQYVTQAFDIASYYAKASRVFQEKQIMDSGQFLSTYLRLVENLKRADKLLQTSPNLLDKWPQAPTTFGPDAGSSALAVAYKFSQKIKDAITVARAFTLGCGCGENFFDGIVPSDGRVRAWLDAAIGELQTRALPPLADWPMWKIHRDANSLDYQLEAEWKKEAEQPAETERNTTPATIINIDKLNVLRDVKAENVQTGDYASIHEQKITGDKKKSIIWKILKIVGAIIVGIIGSLIAAILFQYFW
jgi:hypothetical protein